MPVLVNQATLSNHQIFRDFFEKYSQDSARGIYYLKEYYVTDALVSLHIRQSNKNFLYEMVGFDNMKKTMNEIGINAIKYYGVTPTIQPLSENVILVSFDCNSERYPMTCCLTIQLISGSYKITHQIINIFI